MGHNRVMAYKNLSLSFPDKSSEYLKKLEKQFYKNYVSILIEILKSISMGKEEIRKRVTIDNEQILDKYRKEKKPVIVMTAHYGNWEWAAKRMGMIEGFNHFCFYKPQKLKSIDRLLLNSRKSTGVQLITESDALRLRNYKNKPTIIATLGDHSPETIRKVLWLPFLHQESAFLSGPAKLARILDAVVVFAEIKTESKGHYRVHLNVLSENPEEETEEGIILKYIKKLEETIEAKPQYWMWSRNRWKRKTLK